jgi:hypothetical protein
VRRYTRTLFTHHLKQQLHDLLGYGLALEGLAAASLTGLGPRQGASDA